MRFLQQKCDFRIKNPHNSPGFAARRLLPADSITKNVITAEPDALPLVEAQPKFKVFDRLLLEELGAIRRPR